MARMTLANPTYKPQESEARSNLSQGPRGVRSLPDYWRAFAAHDPEVTARSAPYWLGDSSAAMYW